MQICRICGEEDERIMRKVEEHHLFGRAYSMETTWLCPNCHAMVTADQNSLPPKNRSSANEEMNSLYALFTVFSLFETASRKGKKIVKKLMDDKI